MSHKFTFKLYENFVVTLYDWILFSFVQIKLIKLKNCNSKWFFTIAIQYELKKIDRNIFTIFKCDELASHFLESKFLSFLLY